MKKILFAILLTVTLAGCGKQDQTVCYQCTFGPVVGSPQEPERTVCIDDDERIEDQIFRDGYGNDLSATCTKQ